MAGVSFPVSRTAGEALVVASPVARSQPVSTLATLGIGCAQADEPYAAMAELCRRPMVYRAIILSLAGIYTEELAIIPAIKQRFPRIEVWLTHTDGRHSSLAEAMRLGADGLLADDGLHRIAVPPPAAGQPAGQDAPDPAIEDRAPQAHQNEPTTQEDIPDDAPGRMATHEPAAAHAEAQVRAEADSVACSHSSDDGEFGEPVLTADELRALLQEQPSTDDGANDPGSEGEA